MKRKFKLFATVASLCLCLALMAFGVYAAANVTYTASGSVKFELVDVFVSYESSMTATVNQEPKAAVTDSGKSYTETAGVKVQKDDATYTKEYGETVFKKTGDNVVLVVKITNDGAEAITVKFTVAGNNDNTAGLENKDVAYNNNGTAADSQPTAGFNLARGAYAQCTLTIKLANIENNVASTNYSIAVNAVKASA